MLILAALAWAGRYEDAQAAVAAGRWTEAVPLFETALAASAADARAQAGLALAAARTGAYTLSLNTLHDLFYTRGGVISPDMKTLASLDPDSRALAERQVGEALRLLVDKGYGGDVEDLVDEAERLAGPSGPRTVALAWALRARNGSDAGWALLVKAAGASPEDTLLARDSARFVFRGAQGLPETLEAWLLERADAAGLYDLVAGLANSSQWSRCLAAVERAGSRFPEGASLGYHCAVQAGDAAKIAAWRAAAQARGPLPVADAVVDASRLLAAGDAASAESLLVEAVPRNAAEQAALAGARVGIYGRQGRWEEAVAAAKQPGVDARVVAGLASQLARLGRSAEAKALVAAACDARPEPGRTACYASAPGFGP